MKIMPSDRKAAAQRKMSRKAAFLVVAISGTLGFVVPGALSAGFTGTAHDFSSLQWSDGRTCVACHDTRARWNHEPSIATYTVSNSPTLDAADLGQPSGVSARCLSCHDGTVAVDSFGDKIGAGTVYMTGSALLGTDLRSHHPVSFTYNSALAALDGALNDPSTSPSGLGGTIAEDMLQFGKVECSTCHEVHGTTGNPKLLVISNAGGALCWTCHSEGDGAGHHFPGRQDPWNNCALCHGSDLTGDPMYPDEGGPSCMLCHQKFDPPDPPADSHHGLRDGLRRVPWSTCTECHGSDLDGGAGPSCMLCHSDFSPPDPPTGGHHGLRDGFRQAPWSTCVECHGEDLDGGAGPSCMACHNVFDPPNPPTAGHLGQYGWMDHGSFGNHDREDPINNCATCHGGDLTGEIGPSCFTCHGQTWPDSPPPNLPPVADAGDVVVGIVGSEVAFDGSGSSDDVGIVSYDWDFGDGSVAAGMNPTHTYTSAGTYTVTLTVRDAGGLDGTDTTFVEISAAANLPPQVDPGGPYTGVVGQGVQFSALASDPENDTLRYTWDFGDGSFAGPSLDPTAVHTFAQPGKYFGNLLVSDGENAVAESFTVEVSEEPPPLVGSTWAVRIPFLGVAFTITFEDFGGFLLGRATFPDGQTTLALGWEANGVIIWADFEGTIFFGNIDRNAGTASGIVLNRTLGGSIWFAEQF